MVPTAVLHRVFRIQFGENEGTAFTIDVDGREYLVTARHVVQGIEDAGMLGMFSNRAWSDIPASLVGHGLGELDVSVLTLPEPLTPSHLPCEATFGGMIWGQDAYFLGFPFGLFGQWTLGGGYPMPLIRRATISAIDLVVEDSRLATFLLDGMGDTGFSGGPLVFQDSETRKFKIAGVVVGKEQFVEADRHGVTHVQEAGLMRAYGINHAVELARANPIGAHR